LKKRAWIGSQGILMHVHVFYENEAWMPPLREALAPERTLLTLI
jgi:hypothetical protein